MTQNLYGKSKALANSIYGKDTPAALVNNIGMGLFYSNRGEFKKAFEIYSYIEEKLRECFDESSYLLYLCMIIWEIFTWVRTTL